MNTTGNFTEAYPFPVYTLFSVRKLTLYNRIERNEQAMYVAVPGLKAKPGLFEEALRRIENGFVPLLSRLPGFVMYDVALIGEDEGLSISSFETQEQAEESNRRAVEWVKENLTPLATGSHLIVAIGEVRLHKPK